MYKVASVTMCRFLGLMALALPVSALGQATINVPRDQPTIQAGINAANDGDTVLVAPGKYIENINFEGKAITVTSSGGAATTVIDGGGTGPVVTFGTGELLTSVLSGMTIQNGGGYGTNTTAFGVAGVVVYGSAPTIQNNIITQNQCWDIAVVDGGPLVQGNTISSTLTPAGGCGGGGGSGISIDGNLVLYTNNSDSSAAVVEGNTIENNMAPPATGGGQTFTNLDSENGGAGIVVLGGSPLIENNIIRNNSAPGGNGGGINIAGGTGTTIVQNLIYGNSAGCGGGAISFGTFTGVKTELLVANNTIAGNTGGTAGPFSSCGDVSQIYGANFGLSSPGAVFVNNILSGNSMEPAVGCFSLSTTPSETEQSIFDHNLLYNAGGKFFGPTCVDVSAKYGNVAVAPQFAGAAAGDYHLLQGSPGIDIGNNSALGNLSLLNGANLATDFDGNARVQDATGVGYPIIDIGAYERKGTLDGSPTIIVLISSTYEGTPGEAMTLTASIQSALGMPTGSIAFFLDGQQIGSSTIDAPGYAVLKTVVPSAGTHSFYAAYEGAGSFIPARSVIIIVLGDGPPAGKTYTTGLEIGASINPQNYGMDETFTVLGSSSDPNPAFSPSPITLSLNQGSVIASLTAGKEGFSSFSTKTLPIGQDVVTASYAGDATHQASTASVKVNILGISPSISLTCVPLTIMVGQTSTLTANVSADGGAVIFSDDESALGTVPLLDGTATWTYFGRSTGMHDIEALYPANGAYYRTSTTDLLMPGCAAPKDTFRGVIVVGLPSTSVLSVQPATGPYQTTTTMTATVTPTNLPGLGLPTGVVDFFDQTTLLGTANLVAGVATLSTIELPAGIDAVTCAYQGDSTYAPSDCNTVSVTRSVAQPVLTITASANNIPALTPVEFTVGLSATGHLSPDRLTVVVSAGGQLYPLVLNADGTAGVVVSDLLPGADLVTVTYAGNTDLLSASASIIETVVAGPSMTALSSSPNPGYSGQPVTLAAMVTAADTLVPVGATVTFYDGGVVLGTGTLDETRTATFTTSALAVGSHALTASYPGAGVFLGSTSPVFNETIIASSFTILLSPATITVPVDQVGTVAVQVASVGDFAGPLSLSYGPLPMNATGSILPATVTLAAGGSGASTLTLTTYTRTAVTRGQEGPRGVRWPVVVVPALVLLFPWRRRLGDDKSSGRRRVRLFVWLAVLACVLQGTTGCGNSFYTLPGAAPGSYQIQVTATDMNQRTQTAVLTLNVTPQ